MELLFQTKINNKLNSFTLDNLPHSILLLGDSGCGRHLFIQLLANKFNADLIDFKDNLNYEDIINFQLSSTIKFLYLDCSSIDIKKQNSILKLLEEPSNSLYIFILANNKTQLLGTIINRCYILEFERYTKEQLKYFSNDQLVLELADTPGQIIQYQQYKLQDLKKLCYNIFTLMEKACLPNALSIANKINWKDEPQKYDMNLFYKCLLNESCNLVKDSLFYVNHYFLTKELIYKSNNVGIDQKKLFCNYLLNIKKLYTVT